MSDRERPAPEGEPEWGELRVKIREALAGGTLAGEEVVGGSVLERPEDHPHISYVPDSAGEEIAVPPEQAGTVAGNTTGAGWVVPRKPGRREPEDVTEDLGPEGTIVQEIGGEARY